MYARKCPNFSLYFHENSPISFVNREFEFIDGGKYSNFCTMHVCCRHYPIITDKFTFVNGDDIFVIVDKVAENVHTVSITDMKSPGVALVKDRGKAIFFVKMYSVEEIEEYSNTKSKLYLKPIMQRDQKFVLEEPILFDVPNPDAPESSLTVFQSSDGKSFSITVISY